MNTSKNKYKIPAGEEIGKEHKETKDFKSRYAINMRAWKNLKQDKKQRTYTPWLVLRCNLTDLGFRPVPSSEIVYKSPDIWIESSDALGNAVAGETNFVHAKIFNLGKADASPTKVDFYWGDPSLGLGEDHMNFIGTEWVEVDAHAAKDVRCNTPWIPTFVNNGHECLKVNCSNPILDPITTPFNPREDRHVGQRNIHVLEASQGTSVSFSLFVNNLFAVPSRISIRTRQEHLRMNNEFTKLPWKNVLNELVGYGDMRLNDIKTLQNIYVPESDHFLGREQTVKSDLSYKMAVHQISEKNRKLNLSSIKGYFDKYSAIIIPEKKYSLLAKTLTSTEKLLQPTYVRNHEEVQLVKEKFKAFEQKKLTLAIQIPTNVKKGEFIIYHIYSITEKFLTGGYTIVVKIS